MVKHYGHNYSIVSEKSKCGKLRFYATIESQYGANHFTVMVRKRNGNFSMTPTVVSVYVLVAVVFLRPHVLITFIFTVINLSIIHCCPSRPFIRSLLLLPQSLANHGFLVV